MDALKFSYTCLESISQDIKIDYDRLQKLISKLEKELEMKKKIQKPEDKRNILPRNKKSSELVEERRHCPKCNSMNLLTIGEYSDFTLLFIRDYARVGVDEYKENMQKM